MNIEEQITEESVNAAWSQFQRMPSSNPSDYAHAIRRALMPLVRRAQASKVREIADRALDPRDGIPFDAEHDLAIVSAWLDEEADRIEQEAGV